MRFSVFCFFFLFACNNNLDQQESTFSKKSSEVIESRTIKHETKPSSFIYTFKAINGENGWGYQIFRNGKLLINQMHIPAIQGKKGFKSEQEASIVALHIISKIEQGKFPPTVTEKELDSLNVIK